MYKLWYDYFKRKYEDKVKLCYTATGSFIIYIKSEDFFEDISNDVEKWFDMSNFDKNDKRPLPTGKKKVPGLGRKNYNRICCTKTKNIHIFS